MPCGAIPPCRLAVGTEQLGAAAAAAAARSRSAAEATAAAAAAAATDRCRCSARALSVWCPLGGKGTGAEPAPSAHRTAR